MEVEKIFEVLLYAVPALITGMIAYYFFKEHTKNEDGRRRFLLHKDIQVNTLPIRLQAYERMALFLERITPSKLLIRVIPNSSNVSIVSLQDLNPVSISTIVGKFVALEIKYDLVLTSCKVVNPISGKPRSFAITPPDT